MDPVRKNDRIDVRVRRESKLLINRAALLMDQSVSDFMVSCALERSRQVVREAERVELSYRDAERFAAALQQPPAPNSALKEAVEKYDKSIAEGRLQTS
jgi:uncharacterized protein (DUF1778 family)